MEQIPLYSMNPVWHTVHEVNDVHEEQLLLQAVHTPLLKYVLLGHVVTHVPLYKDEVVVLQDKQLVGDNEHVKQVELHVIHVDEDVAKELVGHDDTQVFPFK